MLGEYSVLCLEFHCDFYFYFSFGLKVFIFIVLLIIDITLVLCYVCIGLGDVLRDGPAI